MTEEVESTFSEGDIHFRDSLQFELKSEFLINPKIKNNIYKQEFFVFIPDALTINPKTYSKEQFYLDQINLIRYKTPKLSLKELIRKSNTRSPLIRLSSLQHEPLTDELIRKMSDELRLLGNIFRVELRNKTQKLINELKANKPSIKTHAFQDQINTLQGELLTLRSIFGHIQFSLPPNYSHTILKHHIRYIDEFISYTIDYNLTRLLKFLREIKPYNWREIDHDLCELIIKEKNYRTSHAFGPKTPKTSPYYRESILYRLGLLDKFVLEALRLQSNRYSFEERHGHLLGSAAAGIAMLLYMLLFWQSTSFGVNSLPLVLLVVVLYILKDRVKEGLKRFYYREAYRWFPDYSTEIKSLKGYKVGTLKENFSFIEANQLPEGFLDIRNREFHEELQALHRLENIIQYKREVSLEPHISTLAGRRREITMIFRFNLYRFLQKAHDSLQPFLTIDYATLDINKQMLPKVYHINIIIRNTYLKSNLEPKSEIKKFRVVVDKDGIKRVEQIP